MLQKAPAKLLLFGEYSVLLGADALASPITRFSGNITYEAPTVPLTKAQGHLLDLANHQALNQLEWLHLDRLRQDLSNGMWIHSDIPSGYGLGSSGMVTALLYANYADQNHQSLEELKTRLAQIESYFHGSSSGIDPLTIFLQKSLLVSEQGKVSILDQLPKSGMHLYLLDSKRKRNTAQLVETFHQQRMLVPDFEEELAEMHRLSSDTLDLYVEASPDFSFFLERLSFAQLRLFDYRFIPSEISSVWQDGLKKSTYSMKLCGAGGGGFFQVWSQDALGDSLGGFPLIEIG
jgi:mevalonate kinase